MRFTRTTSALIQFDNFTTLADSVKAAMGADKLPRGFRDSEVRPALERHQARAAAKLTAGPKYRNMADRRRILDAKTAGIVEALVKRNYKTASGKWAGGNTTVNVRIGSTGARGESTRVWSRNGKWSGLDAELTVGVMRNWKTEVYKRGLGEAGGFVTTHVSNPQVIDGLEVLEAIWVRQGRGFGLEIQRGWIAHTPADQFAFHSTTSAKAALTGLKRQIRMQSRPAEEVAAERNAQAQARRERRAQQIVELMDRLQRQDYGDLANLRLRRQDSLSAGNCQPGTDAFIEQVAPDAEEVTVAELMGRISLVGRSIESFSAADVTLGRRIVATILVAVRREKRERRAVAV